MNTWLEELYDDSFDQAIGEDGLLFIDFSADWCGPCKAVEPVVECPAREYAGRIEFTRLNTDGIQRRLGGCASRASQR